MKRLGLLLSVIALFSGLASAQAKQPDPLEGAWNVAINGNFSSITNAATNNGTQIVEAFRVASHWNLRSDQFLTLNPSAVIVTAGPEYRFSLAHLFKNSTYIVNASKLEAFANVKLGTARSQTVAADGSTSLSTARVAYGAGGGVDIKVNDTLSLRPLDVSYVRASMLTHGGAILGNHLNLAAGMGLRF